MKVRARAVVVSAALVILWAMFPVARTKSYLVTQRTIDVGLALGLCIAVDLEDAAGVWWWEPGRSGCGRRSTGPGVFHPEAATVARSGQNGAYEVGFRLGTHSTTRPFIDVRLLVAQGTMRAAGSTKGVPLVRRSELEIPEVYGSLKNEERRPPRIRVKFEAGLQSCYFMTHIPRRREV